MCAFQASANKGNSETIWLLLGIENPDETSITELMSPTEDVALAAFQKERSILEKAFWTKKENA